MGHQQRLSVHDVDRPAYEAVLAMERYVRVTPGWCICS
jgi:hypothetical protein